MYVSPDANCIEVMPKAEIHEDLIISYILPDSVGLNMVGLGICWCVFRPLIRATGRIGPADRCDPSGKGARSAERGEGSGERGAAMMTTPHGSMHARAEARRIAGMASPSGSPTGLCPGPGLKELPVLPATLENPIKRPLIG